MAYAKSLLRRRFPAGEPAILTNPYEICQYAKEVIKGRWPEAEEIILQGQSSFRQEYLHTIRRFDPDGYAELVLEYGDWAPPVTEAQVPVNSQVRKPTKREIRDPTEGYRYACYVLKGRFKAGEEALSKDPLYSVWYANFLKRNDPEGYNEFQLQYGDWLPSEIADKAVESARLRT